MTAVAARRIFADRTVSGLTVRVVFLALVVGLAVYATPKLIEQHAWLGLALMLAAAVLLVWVYGRRRGIALKYLAPGTLLLIAFQLYPVLYTISTAVTNYGDGHLLSKSQAIRSIESASVVEVPGTPRYRLAVATTGDPGRGPLVFLLTADNGTVYRGTEHGLRRLSPTAVTQTSNGTVRAASGYHVLSPQQINQRSSDLATFGVPTAQTGSEIRSAGISAAYVGQASVRYSVRTGTLTDTRDGTTYRAHDGTFVAVDGSGKRFDTGWKTNVGFANFRSVFGSAGIRGPILRIFLWTVGFALLTVGLSFVLGLVLAVALDHPRVRGRTVYRSLLLLPYALPAFIALLVWQSMYNKDFGLINHVLHSHVDWLGGEWTARLAVLIANVWLTFPYMFLVCTGVLQSVPTELRDAARVDGAGALQAFRSVTLPILLVAVTPLLIASFALNFNNYNAIRLLTNGGPFPSDNSTAGDTDILISYTFRIAFGSQGAQYGVAATISIVIFALVAIISYAGFRNTRRLEGALT